MSSDMPPGSALTRRLVIATVGGLLVTGLVDAQAQPIGRGEPMVWPRLTLLDGTVLPPESWHDRAAVVVFWSTTCAYCRRHNARIDQLYRSAAGAHLRILGVAIEDGAAAVRDYMAANGYSFPVMLEGAGLRARFTTRRVIPMTALVNRRGRVGLVIPGEMAEDDVMALARSLALSE
jgi:thiol-disulfide isomerase/thioredoxin